MNPQFLLPYRCKFVGWIILIPSLVLGILKWYLLRDYRWLSYVTSAFYQNVVVDIMTTVLILGILAGSLLVVFSKERLEDEFIQNLRLSSFGWAILINYLILFCCTVFFYGWGFLNIIAINMFTTLLFYILRFHYLLIRSKHC